MEIMYQIFFYGAIGANLFAAFVSWRREKFARKLIEEIRKKSPTEIDLEFATSTQLIAELLKRGKPVIVLLPHLANKPDWELSNSLK